MGSEKRAWMPEPWKVGEGTVHTGGIATCHDGGPWFEVWSRHWDTTDTAEGNATRIVACVNALAGKPDPQAWVEAVGRLVEAAGYIVEDEPMIDGIEGLERTWKAVLALQSPSEEEKSDG